MANKPEIPESYLTFEFGYDTTIVMPHDTGLILIGALKQAKTLKRPYDKPATITALNSVRVEFLSEDLYKEYVLNATLTGEEQ